MPLLARAMGVLEPQGCFVRSSLHHRSPSPIVHSHTRHLESPVKPTCVVWDYGRKLEQLDTMQKGNVTVEEQNVETLWPHIVLTTMPPRHLLIFNNSKWIQGFSSFKWRKMEPSKVPLSRKWSVFYVIPRFKCVVSRIRSGQTEMCCWGCDASRFIWAEGAKGCT